MVSAEQKTGEQNVTQELKLWEVIYSHSHVPVGEDDFSSQSGTMLVAGLTQEDAREEAKNALVNIVPHRIERVHFYSTISYRGHNHRIKLEPVE